MEDRGAKKQDKDTALSDYLEQQGAEGRSDSEGHFTIDIKVAKRKLAAFQLPTSESWILVLVQAAHRGGSSGIKVTQLARETIIHISGAQHWSWSDLQAVLDGESTTDGAVLAYAVVVRSLSAREDLTRFRIKAPDGSGAVWTGGRLRFEGKRIEDVLLENKTVLEVSHLGEFPEGGSLFFETRRCARTQLVALNQALVRHCFASGIPISVDGLEIAGLHLGEPLPADHCRTPLAFHTIQDYRIPSIPLSASLSSARAELVETPPSSEEPNTLEGEVVSALICLSIVLRRDKNWLGSGPLELSKDAASSRLVWVQDGVVIDSHRLPDTGSLELTLVISAAGLQTDLTGMKLVKSSDLKARKEIVVRLASEQLKEENRFSLDSIQQAKSVTSWLGRLASLWQSEGTTESEDQDQALSDELRSLSAKLLSILG